LAGANDTAARIKMTDRGKRRVMTLSKGLFLLALEAYQVL
jgi:hypothetical protein